MYQFRTICSSTFTTSEVQSIYTPSWIQDWYREDKTCEKHRQHSSCLWMARKMGSPRQFHDRRRRTREGSKPACVQHNTFMIQGGTRRREGWINIMPWYRPVGVAKNLQWDAKEEEPGCPRRVSGRHVVRGRQSLPILEVRPGNREGWWKRSK